MHNRTNPLPRSSLAEPSLQPPWVRHAARAADGWSRTAPHVRVWLDADYVYLSGDHLPGCDSGSAADIHDQIRIAVHDHVDDFGGIPGAELIEGLRLAPEDCCPIASA